MSCDDCASMREKMKSFHRRAQKAEGELQRLQSRGGSWDSPERRREAAERDRMMEAVGIAAERATSNSVVAYVIRDWQRTLGDVESPAR